MPSYGYPSIPGRRPYQPKPPVEYPSTHIGSMPLGLPGAVTSAIEEIEQRQPFSLQPNQRELLARHMIHGTRPTDQELADYSMPDKIDLAMDFTEENFRKDNEAAGLLSNLRQGIKEDSPVEFLLNTDGDTTAAARNLAYLGKQGLERTGFEGFKDASTTTYHREPGSLFAPRFQPISQNNQKYYGHMRAPNLLSALAGQGPTQFRLIDLAGPIPRWNELKEAGEIYERGKDNPLQGYDGLFSAPNYAESSGAAMADNTTIAGTMENFFDYFSQANDSLARRGMEMTPASDGRNTTKIQGLGPSGQCTLGLLLDGVKSWGKGVLSGGIPEAFQYANSLGSARHHGLGMNPSLPGDTYEERMANRGLAENRAIYGEVEDFGELARQRGYGNIGRIGQSLLGMFRGLAGDPTLAYGLGKSLLKGGGRGVGDLVQEGIEEGVMSSPDVYAAMTMDAPDLESMSDEDIEKARLYRRKTRQAMMNPDQSPWLKK